VADWFVINVADAAGIKHERCGSWVRFEDREDPFPDFGINVHVLEPGQPNALYHEESVQEDFLVLSGECLAIVDAEQRPLRAWDFVHCPAGTPHVFVGAGDRSCAILMVGARKQDAEIHYPVDETAARHGASVEEETSDPGEAYSAWGARDFESTRLDWPPG
jgi:uncharacterized cupin superfamily protein